MSDCLTVLVLGGGPDRERPVSLRSAAAVAAALRRAGHRVIEDDVLPENTRALDRACDVVFPLLHGPFGEGGPLQRLLEDRGLAYVGSGPAASAAAMDKVAAKQIVAEQGLLTPRWQLLRGAEELQLPAPLVVKPVDDGSSFGVSICPDRPTAAAAAAQVIATHGLALAERFVAGKEMTVGIVGDRVLPPLQIVPREGFYDYQAKYEADDTDYRFEIDLPESVRERICSDARRAYDAVGCRHLGRVDFVVDGENQPWFLEINTLPGFTDHSLLPMAAAKAGWDLPRLCDHLVRLAAEAGPGR